VWPLSVGNTAQIAGRSIPGSKPPIHFNKEKMERVRPQLQKLRYDPTRYKTYLEQLGIDYPTVQ